MTSPFEPIRGRCISWRAAERDLTELVADIRRQWPDPDDPLCDALLDRLDAIDTKLDHVSRAVEELTFELRRAA